MEIYFGYALTAFIFSFVFYAHLSHLSQNQAKLDRVVAKFKQADCCTKTYALSHEKVSAPPVPATRKIVVAASEEKMTEEEKQRKKDLERYGNLSCAELEWAVEEELAEASKPKKPQGPKSQTIRE